MRHLLILGRDARDPYAELQALLYQGYYRAVPVHGTGAADLCRHLLQPLEDVGKDKLKHLKLWGSEHFS